MLANLALPTRARIRPVDCGIFRRAEALASVTYWPDTHCDGDGLRPSPASSWVDARPRHRSGQPKSAVIGGMTARRSFGSSRVLAKELADRSHHEQQCARRAP
jgi:hypothetical protein